MEQQVTQLMEITQRSAQECRGLLEAANGDLDAAVALSFDVAPAPFPAATQAARATDQATAARPQVEPLHMNLIEELNRDLVSDAAPAGRGPWVVEQRIPMLAALFAPVKYIIGLFSALFGRLNLGNSIYTALPDSKRNIVQFSTRLDQEIGPTHVELFNGSYAEALAEAKSSLRYLVVILLEWKHQDTPTVLPWLKSQDMKRTFSKQDMVVWAGSLDHSEAYQVALGFNATRYPYIALVGPSPKTSQSNTVVMGVLLKGAILDYKSPSDLAHSMDDKAIAHEPKILALRLDRERNEVDRSIRTQQDQAYEESLARDRARAEQAAASERAATAARETQERYTVNFAAWKAAKRQRFKTPAGVTTRVQLRMPSGRVVARFSESDTLADLYDYVLSHQDQNEAEDQVENTTYDSGFEPRYDFKLLIPVEKTALARSNTLIKDEPKVWPNGTLIVEPE